MLEPPVDWNGTSPTGEFADYSGCAFEVDARAAAGAPPQTVGSGSAGAGEAAAALGLAGALLAVGAAYLFRAPLSQKARALIRRP
jgi:hypothetical protein